jgi:hypothetical protein
MNAVRNIGMETEERALNDPFGLLDIPPMAFAVIRTAMRAVPYIEQDVLTEGYCYENGDAAASDALKNLKEAVEAFLKQI